MAVESAVYEVVTAVLSPAEQRDVFHRLFVTRSPISVIFTFHDASRGRR
jgi:hypothetical protein